MALDRRALVLHAVFMFTSRNRYPARLMKIIVLLVPYNSKGVHLDTSFTCEVKTLLYVLNKVYACEYVSVS